MRPASLTRSERRLVGLWVVVGLVLWNGVYDMMLGETIKEYLFRSALHDAGRAPRVSIASIMDVGVQQAIVAATLWASLVVLCGMITIRVLRRQALNADGQAPSDV